MKDSNAHTNKAVAFCGLYCGNCTRFKNGKCSGCMKNNKASWCKIRSCCIEKNISSCAECLDFSLVKQCSKYNNVFAKLIEFVTRTDRSLCIQKIKSEGKESFVLYMEKEGKMSLSKEKK